MPQFPFQSPWESSGIFRWFLLAGCHSSKLKLGPAAFRSLSMASIRFSPTLTCFSPYIFLHPEAPASITLPLHLPTMGPEVIRYAGLHSAAPNGAASCAKSWSTPRHVGPWRNSLPMPELVLSECRMVLQCPFNGISAIAV